mgnify:CR=1
MEILPKSPRGQTDPRCVAAAAVWRRWPVQDTKDVVARLFEEKHDAIIW